MTNKERFHATMNADPAIDRCPVIEWASWWDKTIEDWERQGMPRGMDTQQLYDYWGLDSNTQFWFSHYGPGCPAKAAHGAPLIEDEADYLALRPHLLPDDAVARMMPQIERALPRHQKGETIVWYTLEGFFWFPRELMGIAPHMVSFYDQPELYHRICEDLLAWQLRVVEEFSRYLKADFMTIAEDMSYNHGSMISEPFFDEFIAPYYRRLIPEIKRRGTRVIVDSDGDISRSVPWFERAGVEGILPLERQAGVDIARLQEKHPTFLFIGGFDKMCLLKGREAIDAELNRVLPALRNGRYLPSVDHQTPPGVAMDDYRYYLDGLRDISVQACKGGTA